MGKINDNNEITYSFTTTDIATEFGSVAVEPIETINAVDMLNKAKEHMEDRATTYDSPEGERSMGRAVTAFNSITGHQLKESEGWLLLQLLKDTRQWSRESYHEDSAEDCIAFAALKAESLARGD